jgi:hypothetical protein
MERIQQETNLCRDILQFRADTTRGSLLNQETTANYDAQSDRPVGILGELRPAILKHRGKPMHIELQDISHLMLQRVCSRIIMRPSLMLETTSPQLANSRFGVLIAPDCPNHKQYLP